MLALRTKVVPLRPPPVDSPDLDELSALALRAATRPGARRELLERLQREPVLRAQASKLARALNGHGADDLLQSTLERVVRGLRSYRGDGDFLGWVTRILRNAQIALIRHEAREAAKHAEYGLEPCDAQSDDPAEGLSDAQLRQRVLAAWRGCAGDADVELFCERVYRDRSINDLLRETRVPRSTLYLMLKRGAAKLAAEFQRVTR